MQKELHVLILEDTPTDAELMERELRKADIAFTAMRVDTEAAFIDAIDNFQPDIILSDYKLPSFDGMSTLKIVQNQYPDIPMIMVTGALSDIEAVDLIHAGAKDYVLKDRLARLAPAMLRVLLAEQDVRARKAAEQALQESLIRYANVTANANDAIIGIHQDGTINIWNNKAQQLFGYSVEEAIDKSLHDLIVPERYRPQANAGMEQFRLSGTGPVVGKMLEFNALHKDGTEFPIELSISVMKLEGEWQAAGIIRDISERKQAEQERLLSTEKLNKTLMQTIAVLGATVEARDPYTAGHQQRVATLAKAIGEAMGLSPDNIQGLYLAATVHDLGKIVIPAEILSKPGRLSPDEFALIKNHPQVGYDIIKNVQFPWAIAQIVLQHHERPNGSGYPQGLKDQQILLEAKILAVADVVDSMSSHRPYRPALGIDAALAEIRQGRGSFYDPMVADCCISLFKQGFVFE